MRLSTLAGEVALSLGLACSATHAAVMQGNAPPKSTADLLTLCAAQGNDPSYAAAVNYCQGFMEGAVEIALSYSAAGPRSHRPFCLPSPPPTLDQAANDFVAWANSDAARLGKPAVVGLISYLIDRFPCPHEVVGQRGKR